MVEFDRPLMKSETKLGVSIDKDMVERYVSLIETETTNRMCLCKWKIHPEDAEIKENHCRICSSHRDSSHHWVHSESAHSFQGRRMMRPDVENPECPVHTKSGLILGFIKWAMKGAD
jgi:hypothetical protein